MGTNAVLQRRPRVVIPRGEADMVSLSKGFQDCKQYLGGVRGYSPATLANYERTWGQFLEYLRKVQGKRDEAREFTVEAVMGFCGDLATRGAVGNTILNNLHARS